jgi:hypothetical protein
LLTKDPAARAGVDQARQQLSAVLVGSPPPPPPAASPPVRGALPAASVERLDSEDLRALASASKALLASVARDARDQARHLAEKRRDRKGDSGPVRYEPVAAPSVPPRRRRFKRRWVVVPLVVTVVIVLLVLVGLGLLVAGELGLL